MKTPRRSPAVRWGLLAAALACAHPLAAQNTKINVAIAIWQWPAYFDPTQLEKGIRLDIAEYRRPDPMTAPSKAKAVGLYMICTISKHKAER